MFRSARQSRTSHRKAELCAGRCFVCANELPASREEGRGKLAPTAICVPDELIDRQLINMSTYQPTNLSTNYVSSSKYIL